MFTKVVLSCLLLGGFSVCCGTLFGKIHWGDEKAAVNSKLSILHKPDAIAFADDAAVIDARDVPRVISLSFGIPTAKDIDWNGLLVGDIFSRPKAALSFMLDDVPADAKFDLKKDALFDMQPRDDLAVSDLVTIAQRETVTGHVAAAYGRDLYSVSASADEVSAMQSYNPAGDNYFYSLKNNGWMLLNDKFTSGKLVLTRDEIIGSVGSSFYGQGLAFVSKKSVVTKDGQTVFDLSKKEDLMLFAELRLFQHVVTQLSSRMDVVRDDFPDLYFLTVSSLKGIVNRYGGSSAQAKLAIALIGACVNKMTEDFTQLYNGNILAIATTLRNAPSAALPDSEAKTVFHHLKSQLGAQDFSTFESNLPDLHIFHDLEEAAKSTLCNSLKNTLSGVNKKIKLNCVHDSKAPRITRRSILAEQDGGTNPHLNLASHYSADFPVIFNIWLWLMILLFLIVYVVSLMMWYMDPGRDSIIYRLTSQRVKTD